MIKRHPKKLVVFAAFLFVAVGWIYWNRPVKDDMAALVPADSLAYLEANDVTEFASGIEGSEAWRTLAGPLTAPASLLPHRWLIRLGRWTGIGPIDALLIARSQVALVVSEPQATQAESTLTIKPLAALVIQTHTSQRRMRPALEKHVERFAKSAYGETVLTRKQIDGVEIADWASADKTRHLVLAFIDTVAIVANDESMLMRCVDVRRGKLQPLSVDKQLAQMRQQVNASAAPLFGFIPKAGVKPLIQAWALSRAGATSDAVTAVHLISGTFGSLIEAFAWTTRFDSTGAEDHCSVALASGVTQRLRAHLSSETTATPDEFSYVPPDASSVTSYRLGNPSDFWREVNTVISSHADVLGAIAARPFLRALLEPYGIEDADAFFAAVGPRLQIIRLEKNNPSVLVAEAFDRPALRKLTQRRLGTKPKSETLGTAELLVSMDGSWGAAFDGNSFLIGPVAAVRRCLTAKAPSQSVASVNSFRRARSYVDVSVPIIALSFSNDSASAISFVELFSRQERSAFSSNAAAIQQGAQNLPYSVSATIMKGEAIEWTSKSPFGLIGSLFTSFAPEKSP